MQVGWRKIDGIWYYFDSEGAMKTGWQKIGSYPVTESGEVIEIRLLGRQAGNKIDRFYVTADADWDGQ